MSIKINYSSRTYNKSSDNIVLFSNEKFNITNLEKYLSKSEYSYIQDLLKTSDLKKNLFVFEVNSKKKILLVSIKNNLPNEPVNIIVEDHKYENILYAGLHRGLYISFDRGLKKLLEFNDFSIRVGCISCNFYFFYCNGCLGKKR